MKIIEVYNKSHNITVKIKVDIEDFDFLSKYKWYINIKINKKTLKNEAYAITHLGNKTIQMHRLLLNPPKNMLVDHINGNTLDNRKCNLRICTNSQNATNKKPRGASKYMGVFIKKIKSSSGVIHKYYCSGIKVNGKYKFLGNFPFTQEGEILASKAYMKAAKIGYGDFILKNNYFNREGNGLGILPLKEKKLERGKIHTSNGQIILVDDDDYDRLIKINWSAEKQKTGNYYGINRKRKTGRLYIHRMIMNLTDKNLYVDHIDGNGLNNKKENLRIVTCLQNSWNKKSKYNSSSKFLGVCKCGKKWMATIKYKDEKKVIGTYNCEKEAALNYNIWAAKYFGEYAKLNKI